jgi:hypothetical protein
MVWNGTSASKISVVGSYQSESPDGHKGQEAKVEVRKLDVSRDKVEELSADNEHGHLRPFQSRHNLGQRERKVVSARRCRIACVH